ncbi:large conductance mechanosensitive channel protein MscL [Alkalihalobacillus sp. MEB130]|uniref:large conductance mechanosensitive channel protein MscL n=1 Tax=Alkalihalobacillus sp. MEB130 TaxID=2976704 RepID=UPI0028DFABCD|nr:large conductance mechanosensitive channel protein MscL [Alkalihalobacillus sp. MEB130]MDT8862762.1 large conductance mechanosensitive channel protein MscL [Alkalihalobacillus sp. MEB130]
MFSEFKEFAVRGNVIDMSIGVIIGTTFAKIVESLVDDIIMPPFGFVFGQVDFSNMYINLSNQHFDTFAEAQEAGVPMLNYGMFLNHAVHFMLIAFVLFLVVRQINRIRRPQEDPLLNMKTKNCPHCCQSIAFKATRCPNCTSELEDFRSTVKQRPTYVRIQKKSSS